MASIPNSPIPVGSNVTAPGDIWFGNFSWFGIQGSNVTDYVAADRVGVEVMGINPDWMGYLRFCAEFGLGQYDLAKIDIRGEKIESVRRKYQLHQDIERELQWMGPLLELPTKLG